MFPNGSAKETSATKCRTKMNGPQLSLLASLNYSIWLNKKYRYDPFAKPLPEAVISGRERKEAAVRVM